MLTLEGRSAREIAADAGLSVQRVYQHLDRLRALGFLPPKERAS
jgi:DNA-binding CsgD family transcriptional regulator